MIWLSDLFYFILFFFGGGLHTASKPKCITTIHMRIFRLLIGNKSKAGRRCCILGYWRTFISWLVANPYRALHSCSILLHSEYKVYITTRSSVTQTYNIHLVVRIGSGSHYKQTTLEFIWNRTETFWSRWFCFGLHPCAITAQTNQCEFFLYLFKSKIVFFLGCRKNVKTDISSMTRGFLRG